MSFFLQRAGSQATSSIGSTLWGITTSLAALFSTRVVTWLRPYLITVGFLVLVSWPAFLASAISMSLFFFSSRVSGWYFFIRRRSWAAWFLSMVLLNWLREGGIFRRMSMIFFMRCSLTYFGHLMKRVRSRLGWMSPPMRKLRGAFSKSGFFAAFFFFSDSGALGSFFLPAAAFVALPMVVEGASPPPKG